MNKAFSGFPARGKFTAIHNMFFTSVLPDIQDLAELKTTLCIFCLLYQKKAYPRFVTRAELTADTTLMQGLGCDATTASQALSRALDAAAGRGTLLRLKIKAGDKDEEMYLLNNEAGRTAVERISSGDLVLPGLPGRAAPYGGAADKRDIFSLYEANIGLLTPLIAEELKEAEKLYPADWVADAFKEAVELNKRNWRYISRILERWSSEGRSRGKPGRYSQEKDLDKYIRGKYGHVVRRS
ncbi:MAG: DnaD domain protein [Chloroflexi bacterium]|nr:DnaD domain protein [Chloroflexota bacterium]